MLSGLSPWLALGAIAIVFAGAAVQGSLGIGLGLVAAPVLTLIDHDFVPGAIALMMVPLSIGVAFRERDSIDRAGASLAVAGRIPGVVLGSVIVATTGATVLGWIVGTSVLIAVILSITAMRFNTTPRNLVLAGVVSGFTGTSVGIGGPPMALTYQHSEPAVMRSTLAAFFTVGASLTIVGLVAVGELRLRQLHLAAIAAPGLLAGLYVSKHMAAAVPARRLRPIVLAVCAVSASALLVKTII